MMHEFDWSYDDLPKLAQGTAAGHLLECTASVTGGCFGWPGKKDVPDLARNGYPFADVDADGAIRIGLCAARAWETPSATFCND